MQSNKGIERSSPHHSTLLPVDTALPGLALLGDTAAIIEIARQAKIGHVLDGTLVHVRYKPGTNCVTTYRMVVVTADGDGMEYRWLFAKCYSKSDFTEASNKARTRRCAKSQVGSLPVIIDDVRCIIFDLSHDDDLPGLTTVLDSRKLARKLYDAYPEYDRRIYRISDSRMKVRTVRFKPEKRAVFQIDTRVTNQSDSKDKHQLRLYARLYADNQGRDAFRLMSQLDSAFSKSGALLVPAPLNYCADKRLLFMRNVEGTPVADQLDDERAVQAVAKAGEALAVLHRFTDESLAGHQATSMVEDLESTARGLTSVLPELKGDIDKLLTMMRVRLHQEQAVEIGFIHGDFHPGQVLVAEGLCTAILDFDRSGHGEYLADLGNFIAHLNLAKLSGAHVQVDALSQALVRAYECESGRTADPLRLRLWTALGLLQLAISPFRNAYTDWRNVASLMVNRCREVL